MTFAFTVESLDTNLTTALANVNTKEKEKQLQVSQPLAIRIFKAARHRAAKLKAWYSGLPIGT
jgi:hypothetical protein